MGEPLKLKRVVTLPMITLYGLGTIIGAGIFVLVGKVAGIAGMFTPIAFLAASIIAGFTAFSYAELSSRFPKSSGEAAYLQGVFHLRWLSTGTGIAIAAIGIISAATITNGAVGYIRMFIDVPDWLIVLALVTSLALLAIWGISESVGVAATTTTITIIGLLLVASHNFEALLTLPERLPEMIPRHFEAWQLIIFGGFIAFYAFIGFEDMINLAEEVKEPEKNMPRSIILALVISTLLYGLVSLAAVLAVAPDKLAASSAPLAALIGEDAPILRNTIGIISIFAVADGILIQVIKTSRILYGMSSQQLIMPLFSSIHPRTRTPLVATLFVALIVLALALSLPLLTLAHSTSFITLSVFAAINFTLWRLKRHPDTPRAEGINVPAWMPLTAFILCMLFIAAQLFQL